MVVVDGEESEGSSSDEDGVDGNGDEIAWLEENRYSILAEQSSDEEETMYDEEDFRNYLNKDKSAIEDSVNILKFTELKNEKKKKTNNIYRTSRESSVGINNEEKLKCVETNGGSGNINGCVTVEIDESVNLMEIDNNILREKMDPGSALCLMFWIVLNPCIM